MAEGTTARGWRLGSERCRSTSTGVTSWCALALGYTAQRDARYNDAVAWVLAQSKPDYSLIERLVARVQRVPEAEADAPGGAPWYPDTAAWVGPSVMMVLALRQAIAHGYTDPRLPIAIERAQRFLLARRCRDGGWNHGGTHFRSPNSNSYPEMTGMALLAFAPGDRDIQQSVNLARQMAQNPPSCEAQAWLRMALVRHTRAKVKDESRKWHSTQELALQILSLSGEANPLIA